MKKILFFISFMLFPTFTIAEDITKTSIIKINENKESTKLTDSNENTFITIKNNDEIIISNEENIKGVYIVYELKSMTGKIKSNNKEYDIGKNNFLHEYIEIDSTNEITINYDEDVKIGEIYILSEGKLPEYIEVWEEPCTEADLLLFSTHSDDEQLFFLGLLPTYVAKGAYVQVVYYVNHNDNPKRLHEQLHGLYTVGIKNYPIMGIIPDAYSESLEGAINNLKRADLTIDDAINFQIEMIRRFKPQVIVGHDEQGEYSHGQHILNTHTLKIALERTSDQNYHKESFDKYGLWDVPKTYLHLYSENKIIMNYDIPLEYFDGKTAYEVSKEGYSKHNSQQWTWFTKWINGNNNEYTKSTDIKTYSPNEYGLYKTLVGEDIKKNDMFENLTLKKDQVKEEEKNYKTNINNTITDENNNFFNKNVEYIILGLLILIPIIIIIKRNKVHK